MPRIRMPDGTVLEAPDGIPREQLRAWADSEMEKRKATQYDPRRDPGVLAGGRSVIPLNQEAGMAAGETALAASPMLIPGTALGGLGLAGRVLASPVTQGAIAGATSLWSGHSPSQAATTALTIGALGRMGRAAKAGRRFQEMLRKAGERFSPLGGARAIEEASGAMAVPGRTLTKPSAPPFLPKGKMRLDLGPTEQTTLTGTVGTSRPALPKPQMSSTGAAPKGRVSQPNVSVRTEAAREAMAAPAGPAKTTAPTSREYGGPLEADLKASIAREKDRPFRRRSGLRQQPGQEPWRPLQETARRTDEFTDEITSRIRELAREGRSRAEIAKKLNAEFGATPGQSATAMDAVLKRSRQ